MHGREKMFLATLHNATLGEGTWFYFFFLNVKSQLFAREIAKLALGPG